MLETNRLILRNWSISDVEDAFLFYSNPNCMIPQGDFPITSKDECLKLVEYLVQAKNNYAIVLKEHNLVIGSIGLNEDAMGNSNVRNIGYILSEHYWNQGIMSEALEVVIANASSMSTALSAICYDNPKSKHLLEKFGFKVIDTIVDVQKAVDQNPHDAPYYILKLL